MQDFFRTRTRIVADSWSGFECRYRKWWMPFYIQGFGFRPHVNTSQTLAEAEERLSRAVEIGSVIKQVS